MSSSSKSTENKTATTAYDPTQVMLREQNYLDTRNNLGSIGPYTGELVAGFNPTQLKSQGILSGIATDPKYGNINQGAINSVQGILGGIPTSNITPKAVTPNAVTPFTYNASTYNPTNYDASLVTAPSPYSAAQLSGTDLSPYESPFQKDVIDASIAQNQYARQQQGVADDAAATAAHAFGGSRQGVQRAETNAAYDRNDQQNLASLNQANFAQAQQGALADIAARNNASQFNNNMAFNVGNANAGILNNARQFSANAANQAGQFNAGSLNQAGQFNAGQQQAAGIFNAGQDLNAQQFNSGQDLTAQQNNFNNTLAALGLKMNAAGQLVALNQADLARATQQAGILSAIGDTQQQQQQAQDTAAYQSYLTEFNRQLAQQQAYNQALGLIPIGQTTNEQGTTTTSSNPGFGGILGGIASLGMGIAGLPTSSLGGSILGNLFKGGGSQTAAFSSPTGYQYF